MAASVHSPSCDCLSGTPELAELGRDALVDLRYAIRKKLQPYNFDRHTMATIVGVVMAAMVGEYKPQTSLYDCGRVEALRRQLQKVTVVKDTTPYNASRSHKNVDRYRVAEGKKYTVEKYIVRAEGMDQNFNGSVHVFKGVIRPARRATK